MGVLLGVVRNARQVHDAGRLLGVLSLPSPVLGMAYVQFRIIGTEASTATRHGETGSVRSRASIGLYPALRSADDAQRPRV
jgi:hypothetical protein